MPIMAYRKIVIQLTTSIIHNSSNVEMINVYYTRSQMYC
jgi:hypothetical protein